MYCTVHICYNYIHWIFIKWILVLDATNIAPQGFTKNCTKKFDEKVENNISCALKKPSVEIRISWEWMDLKSLNVLNWKFRLRTFIGVQSSKLLNAKHHSKKKLSRSCNNGLYNKSISRPNSNSNKPNSKKCRKYTKWLWKTAPFFKNKTAPASPRNNSIQAVITSQHFEILWKV